MLPRTNPSTAPFGESSSAEMVDQALFYERVNLRDEKFGVEQRLERKLANITDEDVARDMANSRVGEEPFRIAVLQHSMVCRLVEASRERAAGRKPSPLPRRFVQPQPRRADDDGAGGASAAPRQPIDNPIDVAMMVLKTLSGERAASCPDRALHRPPSRLLSHTDAHIDCPLLRGAPARSDEEHRLRAAPLQEGAAPPLHEGQGQVRRERLHQDHGEDPQAADRRHAGRDDEGAAAARGQEPHSHAHG
jgi:hypothetical protein